MKPTKQLDVKLMTKSGGKPTFPVSVEAGAVHGSRWKDGVFVGSSRHLAARTAHLTAGQHCAPGIIRGGLFISVCCGRA